MRQTINEGISYLCEAEKRIHKDLHPGLFRRIFRSIFGSGEKHKSDQSRSDSAKLERQH